MTSITRLLSTAAVAVVLAHSAAQADVYDFGAPAQPGSATRTIAVTMGDNYYEPGSISVEKGEVVRFVITNGGDFLHEFALGTPAMHEKHQGDMAEMQKHGMLTPTSINKNMNMDHSAMGHGGMDHKDANSVLVEPGKTAELVWKFGEATTIEYACNIPGHYQSGMVGELSVQK